MDDDDKARDYLTEPRCGTRYNHNNIRVRVRHDDDDCEKKLNINARAALTNEHRRHTDVVIIDDR